MNKKTRVYSEEELVKARQEIKLFTIDELCTMFACGRMHIDNALNSGRLKYMSPNNRDRYIYLDDFLKVFTSFKTEGANKVDE